VESRLEAVVLNAIGDLFGDVISVDASVPEIDVAFDPVTEVPMIVESRVSRAGIALTLLAQRTEKKIKMSWNILKLQVWCLTLRQKNVKSGMSKLR
jgi:hypothetical protein